MKKRILMSMMALLLLFAMASTASAVSVTRNLPDEVAAGAEFEVSISQTGFFFAGTVTEVLPAGYAYVDGSAANVDSADYDSDTRTLVLKIDADTPTATYRVTAGTASGTFTGTYATIDAGANPVTGDVTGDSTVTIDDGVPPVSVTRNLPDDAVAAGAEFEVSISQTGFFVAGTVTEVLPAGYVYVDGSATNVDSADYDPDTRTLVLGIDAETPTVTYRVTAGTASGTFTGTYATVDAGANPVTGDVTGDSTVTIEGDVVVSVTRDLPDDAVAAGAEFQVSISQTGFFVAGTVTEVLPEGYTYVDGSAANVDSADYDPDTRTLVLGIDSETPTVTYRVTAGTTDGTFTGTYATIDMHANPVTGDVNGEYIVTIPPQPEVTSPAKGSTISGTVLVTGVDMSGEDNIAYALFEYYSDSNCNCIADDGNDWVELDNDTSSAGGWSTTWDTAALSDCCYMIRVTMGDGIGQTGSDQINVVLSNHDPMPNVTAPNDGDVISGSAIINAVDESFESGADIVYCMFEYYRDENCNCIPDDENDWVELYNDTDGTDGWSAEWDMLPSGIVAHPDGCYMIRATMGDVHGRNGSAEINVNLSNPDFCLDLKEGWNFVSIPKRINGSDGAIAIFDLVQGETCLYYDGCAGGWLSNNQIYVVPCQGYWVYKIADERICVHFDPGTGQSIPPSQNLCKGWNMIGHISTSFMPIDDGSDADFGSITTLDNKLAQIWQWTQEDGYTGYPLGGFTHMTPGQGYWILMKEDATMYGTL